ncbi:hypothetical protein Q5427_12930 [Brochothrix thermosphacta]|uniref:hypothetical protein n=1 Tax=Brochothrix thermosphacta TaxID=2756 RepID=UPI0027130684|nr:hypothetical protein [Brochothrix thermosphacta]MDO7865187.1 hypothetical protein [Brochothrix thermosphacta]
MTIEELARAFEVSVEELEIFLMGATVTLGKNGEQLFPFSDIVALRDKFVYDLDVNLPD